MLNVLTHRGGCIQSVYNPQQWGSQRTKLKVMRSVLNGQESLFDIQNPNLIYQIKEIIMCKEEGIKDQPSI